LDERTKQTALGESFPGSSKSEVENNLTTNGSQSMLELVEMYNHAHLVLQVAPTLDRSYNPIAFKLAFSDKIFFDDEHRAEQKVQSWIETAIPDSNAAEVILKLSLPNAKAPEHSYKPCL
jgi:hypothetical protein